MRPNRSKRHPCVIRDVAPPVRSCYLSHPGCRLGSGRPMPYRIFDSYRREDSAGYAGRLNDRLALEFGKDSVFMDVDGIPLGVDFVKRLTEEVAKCDVLLAVIGPRWIDLPDDDGTRRLDNPNDFVRVEIRTALARDIPVIPILLDKISMPRARLLPDDLKAFAVRTALALRHETFHADLDRLVKELKTNAALVEQRRATAYADLMRLMAGGDTPSKKAPAPAKPTHFSIWGIDSLLTRTPGLKGTWRARGGKTKIKIWRDDNAGYRAAVNDDGLTFNIVTVSDSTICISSIFSHTTYNLRLQGDTLVGSLSMTPAKFPLASLLTDPPGPPTKVDIIFDRVPG